MAQSVNVTTSETANVLNSAIIAAENTPSANVSVTVNAPAVISGGTNVFLAPTGTGQGDGAISFTNTGNLGVVTGGTINDYVGLRLYGVDALAAGNTATVNNTGLVTNSILAQNFGGAVSITNGGTVYGTIAGSGFGDVTVVTSPGGSIVASNPYWAATADAYSSSTSATGTDGVTTTTFTGGNARIDQNGNALLADGTTPANLLAISDVGNSTVNVGATAGEVVSVAGNGVVTTVSASQGPALNATTTTYEDDATYGSGASTVNIAATGSVTGIYSAGAGGGSAVTVAGKVGPDGVTSVANHTNYTNKQVVVQDGTGTTGVTDSSSTTKAGGVAAVTVASGGSVAGGINAYGDAGASVIANGNVSGDINANQQTGSNYAYTSTYTPADGKTVTSNSYTYAPGTASIAVGPAVTVDGSLNARSNGDATVTAAATSIVNGDVFINTQPGNNTTYTSTTVPAAPTYTTSNASTSTTAGGAATFNNAGYVAGNVNINAVTGATVTNSGQVTGQTYVSTNGSANQDGHVYSLTTGTASGITTVVDTTTDTHQSTGIAGNITGTYSGTNGQVSFSPNTSGDIYQYASGNSSVTESGTVYGSIDSRAGYDTGNSQSTQVSTYTTTSDGATPVNGSYDELHTNSGTSTSGAGTSTVNVSGHVSNAYAYYDANVNSHGTTGSTVNVSGTVDGNVTSTADGINASQYSNTYNYHTVTTAGVTTPTLLSTANSSSYTTTGGAAAGNITGTGTVNGNLNVTGVSSATSQIDAGATLNNSLYVYAGGTDGSSSSSDVRTNDPVTNVATRVQKDASSTSAAAASGNASANVDGHVYGYVTVNADRGNASASIQGQVSNGVDVTARSTSTSYTNEYDKVGVLGNLNPTTEIHTSSYTNVGGTANVLIDTSAAYQQQHVGSTTPSVGWVDATGVGGATVTVAAGSRVGGDVNANSTFTDYASTDTRVWNAAVTSGTDTTVSSYTAVGNAATIVNNGVIDGGAYAYGLTAATVTNSGTADALEAYSLNDNGYTQTTVDNDFNNISPSTHAIVSTWVVTPVGGVATVTNTGTTYDVDLAGATGTLTNSGKIDGNIYLGQSVANGTFVQTVTSTTVSEPAPVFTPSTTLFNQAYTVDQNGVVTGDFYIGGADWNFYGDGKNYKTSNVAATINLNTGSNTTGTFYAENDTQTVVNVNGGSLILSGDAYVPASATNLTPYWSGGLDGAATAGSFLLNVNSGTAQITPINYGSNTYGLNGSVSIGNNGTLVVGLLNTPTNTGPGSSINAQVPTVSGANLNVSGNFASTGTVVVGVNGTLVQTPAYALSTLTDFLAPITTGLNYYGTAYTTPAALGGGVNTPSSVTVGGNLNLGGKIQVYVPKGSIFTGTESQTLFTVGGTITNTATVSSNMNSQFVTLAAVTSGQDVVVKATRLSYATAATSPNAAAAAVGLDKAIPGVVKVLVDDASGIRSYTSLDQLSKVQDVANIVSNLDWSLSKAQAAEVFNELASASIYGSLANLHQNVAFEGQLDQLAQRRDGKAASVSLWLTPVGNFAKFGGTSSGAAKIDATSYGAAFGLDIGYGNNGAFGFGFGYAKHNVDAQNSPASVDGETYTLGAYWAQGFGPISVNAKFDYGFSTFNANRDLALLSRKISARFRGNEWDGSLGVSYTLNTGGFDVVPFGELALRHWHTNGFSEVGGAGVGLDVQASGKTVFDPTIGVRLGTVAIDKDGLMLRPYASAAYTFQGDAGTARTVGYQGDPAGNTFVLNGVDPKGYATLGAGVTALVADKVSISLGGTYAFGSNNNVAGIRSVIGIKF